MQIITAALPIDTSYFNYMSEAPYSNHVANDTSLASWK